MRKEGPQGIVASLFHAPSWPASRRRHRGLFHTASRPVSRRRTLDEFIDAHKRIRDKETHMQLKEDLIEHLWNHYPDLY